MICPYCNAEARLMTGREMYPNHPQLSHKRSYKCAPCDASVGCHPGTSVPLGTLASAPLRKARSATHRSFDRLWRGHIMSDWKMLGKPKNLYTRREAYDWLSEAMGMEPGNCHIGQFNEAQCRKAEKVSQARWAEMEAQR
jgi:hypothetical protein